VAVPGADAIAEASVAARGLGNGPLADRLDDLSLALTNLFQDPASGSTGVVPCQKPGPVGIVPV
jgi:hypothetical protein